MALLLLLLLLLLLRSPHMFTPGALCTWYRPTTLDQLLTLKSAHNDLKLVGGNSEVRVVNAERMTILWFDNLCGCCVKQIRCTSIIVWSTQKLGYTASAYMALGASWWMGCLRLGMLRLATTSSWWGATARGAGDTLSVWFNLCFMCSRLTPA
jgi:hypothetical protein